MAAVRRHAAAWQRREVGTSHGRRQAQSRVVAALAAAVLLSLLVPAAAQPLAGGRAPLASAHSTWTDAVALLASASDAPLPPPLPPAVNTAAREADIRREMGSIVHDDLHEALEWFEYPPLLDPSGNTTLMHGIARLYGPNITENRLQTTHAVIKAARDAFAPARVRMSVHYVVQQRTAGGRVTGFPRAPDFEAIDIFFAMTVPRGEQLTTPLTVDLLQLGTAYVTRQLKQARLASGNLLMGLSFPAAVPESAVVAPNAQFESILEATGSRMPFEIEKQTALLSVLHSLTDASSNIAALNITWPNGEPTHAAFPTARKLLAGRSDAFYVGLGMVVRPGSTPPEQFCNQLFTGLLGNGLYKKMLAGIGLPLELEWVNTTAIVSYAEHGGIDYDTSVYDAPADDDDDSIYGDDESAEAGLSSVAIGGISAAAAACGLAAALAAIALWRRRRRRRRDSQGTSAADKRAGRDSSPPSRGDSAHPESSSESSPRAVPAPARTDAAAVPAVGLALKRALGSIHVQLIDPGDITICKREDGSDWLLGAGSFGKAYKGLLCGHQEVAVKQLRPASGDTLWFSSLAREISIMSSISSGSNIVQYHGACLAGEDVAMLVMEHCAGGDLRKAWLRNEGLYAWGARGRAIALDIACGLQFLHSRGIIHRDLKTSNILLTADGTAKVSDVGLSTVMTAAEPDSWHRTAGSFNYASPELLLGVRGVAFSTDIFSFGVLLWEICTQEMPIRGQLRDIQVPQEAPAEVAQLINECLQPNPALRPTAAQLHDRIQAVPAGPACGAQQAARGPLASEMVGQDNGQRGLPCVQGLATLRDIYVDVSRSLQAGARRAVSECDYAVGPLSADDGRSSCSCPDCQLEQAAAPASGCDCADCRQLRQGDRQQQQQAQQWQQHSIRHPDV